jgi:hypothetical protein
VEYKVWGAGNRRAPAARYNLTVLLPDRAAPRGRGGQRGVRSTLTMRSVLPESVRRVRKRDLCRDRNQAGIVFDMFDVNETQIELTAGEDAPECTVPDRISADKGNGTPKVNGDNTVDQPDPSCPSNLSEPWMIVKSMGAPPEA